MDKQTNILIVDDEKSILDLLSMYLSEEGFNVSTAENSEEALGKVKGNNIQLVITDIVMEGMDGIGLLKEIKNFDPDIEVIIITGYANVDTAIKALELGAYAYLKKPLDNIDDIQRVVEKALERRRLKIENRELIENLRMTIKQLKDTQAQLIQSGKMAAVGQLAGGVAHEINNPLSGVLLYAQRLIEKASNEELKNIESFKVFPENLRQIAVYAERCHKTTQDLLAFSRYGQSEFTQIEINEVVGKALGLVRGELGARGIKLKEELWPDKIEIKGNMSKLQQVLVNLILNGIQAMSKRGELRISTGMDGGTTAWIRVSDTGIGIPEERLERIFEPFFTTKPAGQGTGLGLSIAYGIVQEHKGEIGVEIVVGEGSIFTIKLPTGDR